MGDEGRVDRAGAALARGRPACSLQGEVWL